MSKVPEGLKYTKEHEWVRLEGKVATIGITDHAQEQLGAITYVELPRLGGTVQALKTMGTVESIKAASDLYSPVSGQITAVNAILEENPEQINQDPYGQGWLVQIAACRLEELDQLLDSQTYAAFLARSA